MTSIELSSSKMRPPACLQFRIGGFAGSSWELAWIGGQLWFREGDARQGPLDWKPWQPFEPPDAEHWARLHDLMDEGKVWEWPKKCVDHDVLDGTQWSLKIRWGRHRRSVHGENAFPAGFDQIAEVLRGLASRADLNRTEVARLPRPGDPMQRPGA